MTRSRLLPLVSMLYAAAIVISIFTGGLVPVAIVGAVVVGAAYSALGGGRFGGGGTGVGRQRNRNRDRRRDRA